MIIRYVLLLGLLCRVRAVHPARVLVRTTNAVAEVTSPPSRTPTASQVPLEKRQTTVHESTCGFYNQDASQPRTAGAGFDCRVDVANSLWGFCPTTVISASDCGLAGACVDSYACTSGCGNTGSSLTTFFCTQTGAEFCSTVLSDAGIDQTYSYIACGGVAVVQTIFAEALLTTAAAQTTEEVTTTVLSAKSSSVSSNGSSSSTFSQPESGSESPDALKSSPPSSTLGSASPSTETSSPGSKSNNVGAIVGGVLGGIAMLCVTAVAIIYIRRRRKGQKSTPAGQSSSRFREAPAMQVDGIHEVDGNYKRRTLHEKDGSSRTIYEKDGYLKDQASWNHPMPQELAG